VALHGAVKELFVLSFVQDILELESQYVVAHAFLVGAALRVCEFPHFSEVSACFLCVALGDEFFSLRVAHDIAIVVFLEFFQSLELFEASVHVITFRPRSVTVSRDNSFNEIHLLCQHGI